MPELEVLHTSSLDPEALTAIRSLLNGAFAPPDFTEDDWEHALGGLHVLCHEGGELIGHAAIVQRRLLYQGHALRAGYVESVAVREDCRRRGHGSAMMLSLERVILNAYDLGALNSSGMAKPFYATRRWKPWIGPLAALTPTGVQPTTRHEDVHVFISEPTTDLSELLVCDWRGGNPW